MGKFNENPNEAGSSQKKIHLYETTIEELVSKIKSSIIEDVSELLNQATNKKQPPEYLTRKEVLQLLKVDSSTLWRWTKNGTFKQYPINNRSYYLREDIVKYLS